MNFIVDFSDLFFDVEDKLLGSIIKKSKNIKLSEKNIKKYNAVVLITDHDKFNYKMITKYPKILIDTRNRIYRKNNFFRL